MTIDSQKRKQAYCIITDLTISAEKKIERLIWEGFNLEEILGMAFEAENLNNKE